MLASLLLAIGVAPAAEPACPLPRGRPLYVEIARGDLYIDGRAMPLRGRSQVDRFAEVLEDECGLGEAAHELRMWRRNRRTARLLAGFSPVAGYLTILVTVPAALGYAGAARVHSARLERALEVTLPPDPRASPTPTPLPVWTGRIP
jgi:hypothetical protein